MLQNKAHCALARKFFVVSGDCACDWGSYPWLHWARKKRITHNDSSILLRGNGEASAGVQDGSSPS